MSGWWRQNRFWLPAVPVALAALLVASSYNLVNYWWPGGLHHQIASADRGHSVEVTQHFDDYLGSTSRTFSVELTGTSTLATYPFQSGDVAPPAGTEALAVHLGWKADPDQMLQSCTVTLVDDRGRRYGVPRDSESVNNCVPLGHEGPDPVLVQGQRRGTVEDGAERPATWSTDPVFLVPSGLEVTRVLVSWDRPQYVALSAS